MTEDEAKTKTCHQTLARVVTIPETRTIELKPSNCIGSACMAWRWGVQHPFGGWLEFAPNKAFAEERQRREDDGRTVGGFCGLAGKP